MPYSNKKLKVAIIGFGEIGKALNLVLKSQGLEIGLWDKNKTTLPRMKNLLAVLSRAKIIFLAVPANAVRAALLNTLQFAEKDALFVFLSKGIEASTDKNIAEIARDLLPKRRFGILSGPMIAEELDKGMEGAALFASFQKGDFAMIKKIFSGTAVYVEHSEDLDGVSWAGVLKNIYAVSLGITEGLGWGTSARGFLVSRIINEMADTIFILGGRRETALSSAGLGDLIATGFSVHSKNRKAGFEIGHKGFSKTDCEGLRSIDSLGRIFADKDLKMPMILGMVRNVFYKPGERKKIFRLSSSDL